MGLQMPKVGFGPRAEAPEWSDGFSDYMLVFPVRLKDVADDVALNREGENSAAWYLQQIIVNEDALTRGRVHRTLHEAVPKQSRSFLAPSGGGLEELQRMFEEATEGFGNLTGMQNAQDQEPGSPSSGLSTAAKRHLRHRLPTLDAHEDEGITASDDVDAAYEAAQHAVTVGELRERVAELFLRYLISRDCGFQLRAFKSVDGDELFIAMTAQEKMLKAHADAQKVKLQLDPELCVELLRGKFDETEISPPYQAYNADLDRKYKRSYKVSAFRRYTDIQPTGSIFRGSDRIRIMKGAMDAVFNLGMMEKLGLLVAHYPCHHKGSLRRLAGRWISRRSLLGCEVPTTDIVRYFGEHLGFRIAHLVFQTMHILPLAIVGPVLLFFYQFPCKNVLEMALGITFVLWAATYNEFWKRTEATWRMVWGMEDFHKREKFRPEFQGEWRASTVDRFTMVKVDSYGAARRAVSMGITAFFIGLVIATTIGWYAYASSLQAKGHKNLSLWVAIAIAIQMKIYTSMWEYLSVWLTDFDNYKTESEYYRALVHRVFAFQFINSFCSLFYIAIFKHFSSDCRDGSCHGDLATQLRILFVINFLFQGISMAMPYLTYKWRLRHEDSSQSVMATKSLRAAASYTVLGDEALHYSFQEAQAKLPRLSIADEVWERIDVIIELGYVLFFGFVAPEIATLSFISTLLRLRAMGFIYINAVRRPFPRGANGIGEEFKVLYRFMCRVAVSSNIILLLFYNAQGPRSQDLFLWLKYAVGVPQEEIPRAMDWKVMLVIFLILDRFVVMCQFMIDYSISDETHEVALSYKRRDDIEAAFHSLMFTRSGGHLSDAYAKLPQGCKAVHTQRDTDGLWVPGEVRAIAHAESVPSWLAGTPWFQPEGLYEETQNDLPLRAL